MTNLKIDVETEQEIILIRERQSKAIIARLYPSDKTYRIDEFAWTSNLFSGQPIDLSVELPSIMTPTECRIIAACPCER